MNGKDGKFGYFERMKRKKISRVKASDGGDRHGNHGVGKVTKWQGQSTKNWSHCVNWTQVLLSKRLVSFHVSSLHLTSSPPCTRKYLQHFFYLFYTATAFLEFNYFLFQHIYTILASAPLHTQNTEIGLGALMWQPQPSFSVSDRNCLMAEKSRQNASRIARQKKMKTGCERHGERESERRREDRAIKRSRTRKTIRCYQSEQ